MRTNGESPLWAQCACGECSGLGRASRWKNRIQQNAAALFSGRGADMQSLVYGTPATDPTRGKQEKQAPQVRQPPTLHCLKKASATGGRVIYLHHVRIVPGCRKDRSAFVPHLLVCTHAIKGCLMQPYKKGAVSFPGAPIVFVLTML